MVANEALQRTASCRQARVGSLRTGMQRLLQTRAAKTPVKARVSTGVEEGLRQDVADLIRLRDSLELLFGLGGRVLVLRSKVNQCASQVCSSRACTDSDCSQHILCVKQCAKGRRSYRVQLQRELVVALLNLRRVGVVLDAAKVIMVGSQRRRQDIVTTQLGREGLLCSWAGGRGVYRLVEYPNTS